MEEPKKRNDFLIFIISIILIEVLGAWIIYHMVNDCKIYDCQRKKSFDSKYCYRHTCEEKGCFSAKNKDVHYCPAHYEKHRAKLKKLQAEYAKKPSCRLKECDIKVDKEGEFCVVHKCWATGCTNRCVQGDGDFCINHTCIEKDCYNYVKTKYTICENCKNEAIKKKNAEIISKQLQEKMSKSKTKKKTMPDCDDYDSYEDFMDDWDGYMPDGSDAEDYWENW